LLGVWKALAQNLHENRVEIGRAAGTLAAPRWGFKKSIIIINLIIILKK
jgi:hypothetical protein